MNQGPVIIQPVPTGRGSRLSCGNCLGSLVLLLIIAGVVAWFVLKHHHGTF
jgi:hypothetical protein